MFRVVNFISNFLRILFLPFLWLFFVLRYFHLLRKAKKYKYDKTLATPEERFRHVAKLVNFYLYLRGFHIIANFSSNLPKNKPVLFISNHKSNIDALVIIHAFWKYKAGDRSDRKSLLTFVAKIELQDSSLGAILSYLDCVFIDRKNMRQAFQSFNEQSNLLHNNTSVCVFPEGTRINTDEFGEFKPAAIKVAVKNLVPIVPIVIWGTKDLDTKYRHHLWLVPKKIRINFTQPIDTFSYAEANLEFFVQNLSKRMYQMYNDLKKM